MSFKNVLFNALKIMGALALMFVGWYFSMMFLGAPNGPGPTIFHYVLIGIVEIFFLALIFIIIKSIKGDNI